MSGSLKRHSIKTFTKAGRVGSGRVVFAMFLSEIEAADIRTDIRSSLAGFAS